MTTVVFDLDGTLIDSIPDIVGAVNRLLTAERRREISLDAGRMMIGDGAAAMIQRAFAATGEALDPDGLSQAEDRFVDILRRHPVIDTVVFPGVEEVLETLAADGYRLGVCTNKPHEMSLLVLRELGMDHYFGAVLGGDALDVRKPDARHLIAVIEELDATPGDAVYVGDSPTDSLTARNAKVPFVGVSYGYSRVEPEQLGADVLVDHFSKVPDALVRIGAAKSS